MKNLTFLIGVIALVLSSCGTHNALRFVKTNPNQQIVQTSGTIDHSEENIASDESRVNTESASQSQANDAETEYTSIERVAYPDTTDTADEPEMSSDEASAAVQQAQRTEKIAKTAKNLGIAGVVMMWLIFISILALPVMIAALICYLKANRARYTTEQGAKYLKTAKNLLLFYGIVVAVALLLTVVLILLFF